MIVYFNYPRSRISIHQDYDCPHIQKQQKHDQRYIHITLNNLVETLQMIDSEEIGFSSTAESNDFWLEISLPDVEQEMSLVHIIQALFGKRYRPFRNAIIEVHEC